MNISSIVVYLFPKSSAAVLKELCGILGVEIIANDDEKIAILLSSENVDKEIAAFREIESIKGVKYAAMVYSYQEDLADDLKALQDQPAVAKILQNESLKAEDIVYNGNLKDKIG